VLRIEVPTPGTTRLLTWPDLSLSDGVVRLDGMLRFQPEPGDADESYLEAWFVLPDGRRFFSRTLDAEGLAGPVPGDGMWHEFRIRFDPMTGPAPTQVELNLVSATVGTVELGWADLSAEVAASERGQGEPASAAWWWSPSTGGWVGSIGGVLLGILGIAFAWIARSRPRAAYVPAGLMVAAGLAAGGPGLVALAQSQPYHVVFPLALIGALGVLLGGANVLRLRGALRLMELRRMHERDGA
jgi:hypothetical protein